MKVCQKLPASETKVWQSGSSDIVSIIYLSGAPGSAFSVTIQKGGTGPKASLFPNTTLSDAGEALATPRPIPTTFGDAIYISGDTGTDIVIA